VKTLENQAVLLLVCDSSSPKGEYGPEELRLADPTL
jgi:hypothetical protein